MLSAVCAERHVSFSVMLSVHVLSVVMLSVVCAERHVSFSVMQSVICAEYKYAICYYA
jgi:hypothetical protein